MQVLPGASHHMLRCTSLGHDARSLLGPTVVGPMIRSVLAGLAQMRAFMRRKMKGAAATSLDQWMQNMKQAKFQDMQDELEAKMAKSKQDAGLSSYGPSV